MFVIYYMNTNTKKTILKIALFLIPVIFSFADDTSIADNVPFSRIQRIDWNLTEVKTESAAVIIDRTKAQQEIYSIRFQEGLIRGRGAANIYSAPYIAGENNSLLIRGIASTFMVPLFEMENFSEYEYFKYLERVYRWEFQNWKLKLYTYDENKGEVILEFIPIYK